MVSQEDRVADLSDDFWNDGKGSAAARVLESGTRPVGHRFTADADASELDERMRPTPKWAVQMCELGRNHVVFYSRRMVYEGQRMILAIHLLDDCPVVLAGKVVSCDYEGGGSHRIDVDLVHVPASVVIDRWAETPGPRPRLG